MLKLFLYFVLALACVSTASGQIGGCANSTLVNYLGTAGPGNFAVFSMGGQGSSLNINLATVTGSVGVANPGKISESAPSFVYGTIVVGSQVNTTHVNGYYGGIVVDDATVTQAVSDANNAATYFAALPTTAAVQAQFPSNGRVTQDLTVTGDGNVDVVNLPGFLLDDGATLTLAGPFGTGFVINVWGNFNLHNGNIQVSGGVDPLDVVYNIATANATVTTMVPTTGVGVLLAPNNNINSMDSANFLGELIGGYRKSITLMSGAMFTNPCQKVGPS